MSRRNPHHPRRDPLVKCLGPFLLEHLARNHRDATQRRLSWLGRCSLQTRLDRIDRRIRERPYRSRNQSDDRRLPRRQLGVGVLRLPPLQRRFQLCISREVGRLVGSLSERRQRDAPVESAESFLAHDREQCVRRTAIFRCIERIGERVVLRLQTDLDHFHRIDHCHCFGDTCSETGCSLQLAHATHSASFKTSIMHVGTLTQERRFSRKMSSLVRQELLIPLVRGEPDRHLGDDSTQHSAETFIQSQRSLSFDNLGARSNEPARFGLSIISDVQRR